MKTSLQTVLSFLFGSALAFTSYADTYTLVVESPLCGENSEISWEITDGLYFGMGETELSFTINPAEFPECPSLLLHGSANCDAIATVYDDQMNILLSLNVEAGSNVGNQGTFVPGNGCANPIACNFDPEALCNYNCVYPGCTDEEALNYNPYAGCEDGSCEYCDVFGCMDYSASNFNIDANCDDGSCEYGDFTAYHAYPEVYAVHDGSTGIPAGYVTYRIYIELDEPAHKLTSLFSTIGTGDGIGPLYIRGGNSIYQHEGGGLLATSMSCAAGELIPELAYDSWVTIQHECSQDIPGSSGVNAVEYLPSGLWDAFETGMDLYIEDGAWYSVPTSANTSTTDGKFLIAQITTDQQLEYALNFQLILYGIPGESAYVSSYLSDGITPNPDAYERGLIYPDPNAIYGCTNPEACNYDSNATADDGFCQLPDGCTDSEAMNYSPEALCDDGSCAYCAIYGCTDELAENYNPDAECDDDSCIYCNLYGCTDDLATNYNPEADCDDESCEYPWNEDCLILFDPEIISYDPPVFEIAVDYSALGSTFGEDYAVYWDSGDDQSSLDPYPQFNYLQGGVYEICLTVFTYDAFNELGCASTTCAWLNSQDFLEFTPGGAQGTQGASIPFSVNIVPDEGNNVMDDPKKNILLYPNPAHSQFCIELPEGIWDVVVLDSSGKRVMNRSQMNSREVINIQNWASGLYTIHIGDGDKSESLRLIVE